MQANSPVKSFWQLGLSHQMSKFLFPSVHYLPPLIIFASIIIHLLQLILSLQFFLIFTSPTHLPTSHCSNAAEVKQQLISCWYDWIRHRMMEEKKQLDVMPASWFSFELNILTLLWLQSRCWEELNMEKGKETNMWLNLSTVSTSISWCPALIRMHLFPTPTKIPLLLFSNHLVCASNHLLLRHLRFWLLMQL